VVRAASQASKAADYVTLIERRSCMELFRDRAAERFEVQTGSPWRPRAGSQVSRGTLTPAMIDCRDFLAARRGGDTERMLPAGLKIALTGGLEFNDYQLGLGLARQRCITPRWCFCTAARPRAPS
jgi:hypothetical protein